MPEQTSSCTPFRKRTASFSDEFGLAAVEKRMHMNDLHSTLLAIMGIDHERLTYRYEGRDLRLTDVAGEVQRDVFA